MNNLNKPKLSLNKTDLVELNNGQLNDVVGGSLGDLIDFIEDVADAIEAVDNFIDNLSKPQL